jgi:NAD(P) transhydrogenase subunit alpha
MQIGIPRESLAGETRVAATPATVEQLKKLGFEVAIEAGAGSLASFDDAAFEAAGASVVPSVWQADLIFKVNAPTDAEITQIKDGATLVSFIWPAQNPELVKKLSERNINVMAMDMVPRISRAQSTSVAIAPWSKPPTSSVASSPVRSPPPARFPLPRYW